MAAGDETQRDGGTFLALLVLAASLALASAFTVWRMRDEALKNGLVAARTHVRSFEEHLTQTLQLIDVTATQMDVTASDLKDSPALGKKLTAILRPLPFIRSMSILDSGGRIVASSNIANIGARIDFGDFYPVASPSAQTLRIGRPWRGRDFTDARPTTEQQPVVGGEASFIPLLRRLDVASDAWLVVALNPDYYINYWTQLLDVGIGHVQLLRYDDVLLGSSAPGDMLGKTGQSGAVLEKLSITEHGDLPQALQRNQKVLTAYRASSRYPAVLAVHVDEGTITATWQGEAIWIGTIVTPILIALLFAAVLLWRNHQRFAAQKHELASERRLAASVFDASSVAILISNERGEILAVNPAFERDSGYSSAEAVGRTLRFLISGLSPEETYSDLWTTISQGQPWRRELQNRRKNGETYWESVIISPVLLDGEMITHYVALMEDISTKKRNEIELFEAKQTAEVANLAKSQFLTTMSHELRTPLNGILGFAQLTQMSETTKEDAQDYARTIQLSGEHLLAILNDILDMSKIEAGKLELENIVFSPTGLFDEVSRFFSESARAKGVTIEATWQSPDRSYRGDPIRLKQMLSNLVGNAVKFSDRGTVRIEGKELENNTGSALLEFWVTDQGIGITEDKKSMLFNPFCQIDASPTRKFAGTGLGLSIVRRLAELMDGSVGVDSEEGKGSRFWFRIRVHPGKPEEECRDIASDAIGSTTTTAVLGRAAHILVVEDNPVNQRIIEIMLKKLGLGCTLAENGQLALDAFYAGTTPSLILMDCLMPVMNGYETTERIRAWEAEKGIPRIPIIALTAAAYREDMDKCLACGMDDILFKPVDLSVLTATLTKWIKRN